MPNTVVVDIAGYTIADTEQHILQHPEVAGVLLFSRNVESRAQLQQLTASIHQLNPELFIAIDHEGGFVQRIMRLGLRALPAARVIGEIYDQDATAGLTLSAYYGQLMAEDLLKCGIDLSFAPVLDLHDEKSSVIAGLDRAFHRNPELVSILAQAYIAGMHKAGMPAVGKHFPGHGSCAADSHTSLPINLKSRAELDQTDLKPFADLIQHGELDAVMTAHVLFPAIDAEFAAGFSAYWLKDILRTEFGFQGLVISDCLGMKGADIGGLPQRAAQALTAGCDLLIAANQNQTNLLNLLNTLPNTPDATRENRLLHFKRRMQRFQADKPPHHSELFFVTTLDSQPDETLLFDPNNPTQSV